MNRRESHKLFTTFSICFVPSLEFLFIISVYFTYFPSLYLSISPHLLSIFRCLSLSLYSAVVIHSVSQKLVFCLICLFLSPSLHYFIGCVPPPPAAKVFNISHKEIRFRSHSQHWLWTFFPFRSSTIPHTASWRPQPAPHPWSSHVVTMSCRSSSPRFPAVFRTPLAYYNHPQTLLKRILLRKFHSQP